MVSLFRASGRVVHIKPISRSASVTAKHIRRLLGNAFHIVPLDQNRMMVVQGATPKQTTLLINQKATSLFQRSMRSRNAPANEYPILRGDVLVARYKDLVLPQIVATAGVTV